jgi:hypothetical protein
METLAFQALLEHAIRIGSKDVRRIALIVGGTLETAFRMDPTSPEARQFAKEAQAIIIDHADERGFFGDPFKDERHNAYIFTKRWLPEQYHAAIGVTAGTPSDYPQEFKAKYLGER